jgi:two-component system, response regulator PdtaR
MRVLIVEDEAIIAMHLEILVTEFGHEVCATAASTAEAIAHAALRSLDVVLMDVRLRGGSSGIDAARELYTRQALRCIFLSGNLDQTTKTILSAYEPIEFLGKPVLPILLRQALKKAEGLSKL